MWSIGMADRNERLVSFVATVKLVIAAFLFVLHLKQQRAKCCVIFIVQLRSKGWLICILSRQHWEEYLEQKVRLSVLMWWYFHILYIVTSFPHKNVHTDNTHLSRGPNRKKKVNHLIIACIILHHRVHVHIIMVSCTWYVVGVEMIYKYPGAERHKYMK